MGNRKTGKFSIKHKTIDDPAGEAYCDNGHKFKIANYHQVVVNGERKLKIWGYCEGCKNSIMVIRDEVEGGARRDYRTFTFIEER